MDLKERLCIIENKLLDLAPFSFSKVIRKDAILDFIFRLETGTPHLRVSCCNAVFFNPGIPGAPSKHWILKWRDSSDMHWKAMRVNIGIQAYSSGSPYKDRYIVPAFIYSNDVDSIKYPKDSKDLSIFNIDNYNITWYLVDS